MNAASGFRLARRDDLERRLDQCEPDQVAAQHQPARPRRLARAPPAPARTCANACDRPASAPRQGRDCLFIFGVRSFVGAALAGRSHRGVNPDRWRQTSMPAWTRGIFQSSSAVVFCASATTFRRNSPFSNTSAWTLPLVNGMGTARLLHQGWQSCWAGLGRRTPSGAPRFAGAPVAAG